MDKTRFKGINLYITLFKHFEMKLSLEVILIKSYLSQRGFHVLLNF